MATETTKPSRILWDPLLHFLAAGAAIYAIHFATAPEEMVATDDSRVIVVGAGDVEWMSQSWAARWGRLPTEAEMQGMIKQHVKETALYREALAMGLNENDQVVRRRLAQKLEFLSQDLLQPKAPTEAELRAYYAEHESEIRPPDRIRMTQVFFDPDRRGDATVADAEAAQAQLASLAEFEPADAAEFGDRTMHANHFDGRTQAELSRLFGAAFAETVFSLEPGIWHAPVLSGLGTHLVYVQEVETSPAPDFAEVREDIEARMLEDRRRDLNDAFVDEVVSRFEVVVEASAVADRTLETSTGSGL